jgi:hypothetical protein
MFPLLAVNVAVPAAGATVTVAGTLSKELVLARVTIAPPAGAGWERLTAQLLDAFGPMLVGLQVMEETSTNGARLMVVFAEPPLYAAVMVAIELLAMAAAVTVNVSEVAKDAMVNEPGIVNVGLLFDRIMVAPPVGAACVRVTVQVLEEFAVRLLGLQDRVDSDTGAIKVKVLVTKVPL